MVGYGHAVGVTAEISEDSIRTAEGWLGIDVPVLLPQLREQLFEPGRIHENRWRPRGNRAGSCGRDDEVQRGTCSRKTSVEYRNGQQEPWVVGRNPSADDPETVPRRGPRNVHVIMAQQVLTPGMQDGEKSDLCAEPFRIPSDFEQGLGTGVEEQVKKWPWRSQCQRVLVRAPQ